jgi:hypothetical protein
VACIHQIEQPTGRRVSALKICHANLAGIGGGNHGHEQAQDTLGRRRRLPVDVEKALGWPQRRQRRVGQVRSTSDGISEIVLRPRRAINTIMAAAGYLTFQADDLPHETVMAGGTMRLALSIGSKAAY